MIRLLPLLALALLALGCGSGGSFADGATWPRARLTWQIVESGQTSSIDLEPVEARALEPHEADAYREAIGKWAATGSVELVETPSAGWAGADIIIYGTTGQTGLQRGEVLPHVNGAGELDRVRILVPPPDRDPRLLRYTALHEVGHAIGLGHSSDARAVMFPFRLAVPLVEVTRWDREALERVFASLSGGIAERVSKAGYPGALQGAAGSFFILGGGAVEQQNGLAGIKASGAALAGIPGMGGGISANHRGVEGWNGSGKTEYQNAHRAHCSLFHRHIFTQCGAACNSSVLGGLT